MYVFMYYYTWVYTIIAVCISKLKFSHMYLL